MNLMEVNGLKVHYPIASGGWRGRARRMVRAVDGVDLSVPAGTTLGIVGESGSGKSTLGKAILRLAPLTEGSIVFDGVDVTDMHGDRLRRLRSQMQMVFQDPMASLNPRQNVGGILSEPLVVHGSEETIDVRVQALLDQVGLPASARHKYPHEFSGGQRQRIGIARALALEPRLIVADEPVSALDVSIQAQVLNLLEDLQSELGLTYIVIAHDMAVVRHISDRVAVMYLGSVVEEAPTDAIFAQPLHPYTRALMSAIPVPDPVVEGTRDRIILNGGPPSPSAPPDGCRFHTRCPFRQPTRCHDERPKLREVGAAGHLVACHWAESIRNELHALVSRTGGPNTVSTQHNEEQASDAR